MIKKSLILFKINLINSLGLNQKKRKVFAPVFFLFIGIALFVAFFQYSLMFANYLKPHGLIRLVFPAFSIMGMIMMTMMSSYKARGALFDFKDSDLLFSMPIPESSILIQKIMNMMMFNYLISFITFIPTSIAYFIKNDVVNGYWAFVVVTFLLLPFIPTLIASIFGYIIGYLSSRSKRKSLVEAATSLLIIVLFLFLGTKISTFGDFLLSQSENVDDIIKTAFYPLYWAQNAICYGDVISMMYFVLMNIISFITFVFVLNKLFISINKRMKEQYSNKDYEMEELVTSGKTFSMFKKEFKLYTQSSIYMINTCFGAVSMLIFGATSLFYDTGVIAETILKYIGISLSDYQILVIIGATMAPLSCTTPASISMENKSLWVCRSMPVDEMKIFISKMMVDLLVILPINIIGILLASISFNLTLVEISLLILLMVVIGVSMTQFGILLNIKYPKLQFKSESEAVKGSLSASLAVYIPMAIVAILSITYIIIQKVISFNMYLLILVGLFFVISVTLYFILRTYGVKRFRELYC